MSKLLGDLNDEAAARLLPGELADGMAPNGAASCRPTPVDAYADERRHLGNKSNCLFCEDRA